MSDTAENVTEFQPAETSQGPEEGETRDVGGVAGDRLRSFIERIERLEEEKKEISDNIRDKLAEAKAAGFDLKIIREILKIRKKSKHELHCLEK